MIKRIAKYRTNGWVVSTLLLVTITLVIVAGVPSFCSTVSAQQRTTRRPQTNQRLNQYNRAYLQGYNTGFAQGQMDWRNVSFRDSRDLDTYQPRDPSYGQGQDTSEQSTKGYELGMKLGYSDGYYGRVRSSVVPTNGLTLANSATANNTRYTDESRREVNGSQNFPPLSVPENTEMYLRLTTPINTKTGKVGDRFTAAITSPSRYDRATVEGHIVTLNRSGRITGKTEIALAFDRILLEDGQQGPLEADLVRIVVSEKVKKVDEEGRIETGSRTRDSEVRGGIGAAAGAVIGGIAGGAKGAIIGLVLGGAAGVGTVYIEGNNDLILDNGTEMVIRTARRR